MAGSRKTHYARISAAEDSGVSVSIRWKRSGWALAAALVTIVVARLLGLF